MAQGEVSQTAHAARPVALVSRLRARRVLVLAVAATLLVAPWLAPQRAMAAPGVSATVHAYGLRFTVTTPQQAYMRNALAPVSLRLTNVSHHPIQVGYHHCPRGRLWATVETAPGVGGTHPYPPAVPGDPDILAWACESAAFRTKPLQPGHSIRQTVLVILREKTIVGWAPISIPSRPANPDTFLVAHLRVLLQPDLPSSVPQPTVMSSPPRIVFIPPAGVTGPLYYQQLFLGCVNSDGDLFDARSFLWQPVDGNIVPFTPFAFCPHPSTWRVVAGWIGYPVATATGIGG